MPNILIPRPDVERRLAAHRIEDDRDHSVCGMRSRADADFILLPDAPETWAKLRAEKREMCWRCDGILDERKRKAAREAKRQLIAPTKRELDAERLAQWEAAAKAWAAEHVHPILEPQT